jgi:hypothetical protein
MELREVAGLKDSDNIGYVTFGMIMISTFYTATF